LFTYGITGSGKTHTMTGNPRAPGILPRCLDTIFNSLTPYLAESCTFIGDGANCFYVATEADADAQRARSKIDALPTPKGALTTFSLSTMSYTRVYSDAAHATQWCVERWCDARR
jgi:kinesin family protein 23